VRRNTQRSEIPELLEQTWDLDALTRRRAVQALCPCVIKSHDGGVWRRMIALADDPDPGVRSLVCHTLCDGSPAAYESEVLVCLGRLHDDPDLKVRKMARRVLSIHRRTGRINVL
jgi:hypothetical protein